MQTTARIIAGLSIATALTGNVNAAAVGQNESPEIVGATLADFSSEDTTYGRVAASVLKEEGQWLSETRPAHVTLDLGSYYHLTRLHVRNYWELQVPARSGKGIEVWVVPEPDADFIQLDADPDTEGVQPFTLKQPQLYQENVGETIDLSGHAAANDVRRVRLVVVDGAGLDSVKFHGAERPDAAARLQAVDAREQERLRQIALAKQRRADTARADYLKTSPPGRPEVRKLGV